MNVCFLLIHCQINRFGDFFLAKLAIGANVLENGSSEKLHIQYNNILACLSAVVLYKPTICRCFGLLPVIGSDSNYMVVAYQLIDSQIQLEFLKSDEPFSRTFAPIASFAKKKSRHKKQIFA